MKDKYKLKLLELVEHQVVGILIENEIVEYITQPNYDRKRNNYKYYNNFDNIKISEKHKDKFKELFEEKSKIDTFITNLRAKYTSAKKSTPQAIKRDLEVFLQNHEYSLDYLEAILDVYIAEEMENKGGKYLYSLNNIFLRKDNKIIQYPILNLIEKYKEDPLVIVSQKRNSKTNESDIDGYDL